MDTKKRHRVREPSDARPQNADRHKHEGRDYNLICNKCQLLFSGGFCSIAVRVDAVRVDIASKLFTVRFGYGTSFFGNTV